MGRVLGLDVGDKRIGVALSDETRLIASPYCVIQSVGWGPDSRKIADIMRETEAELIVSGLPYNMDGSLGFQAKKVQDFLKVVEGLGFRVEWIDERLTTVSAQNALIEGGMRREDRRNHVDKVAAAVILQTWLDKEREKKEQPMADNEKNLRMEEGGENDNELPEIIELTDDDGNVTRFEYMTTIDYEGELYVALMLADEEETEDEEEEGNVVILKIEQDENGEDIYVSIEDEALADAVFQKFLDMVDEADLE
jgi:putative Holliday junction resolvase